jgi:hypothetical protein
MKSISFLLAFYVLLCAAIPCCADDECAASIKTATEKTGECKGVCSPFFACGNCCGFSINAQQFTLVPIVIAEKPSYAEIYVFPYSSYLNSFWQPPRLG